MVSCRDQSSSPSSLGFISPHPFWPAQRMRNYCIFIPWCGKIYCAVGSSTFPVYRLFSWVWNHLCTSPSSGFVLQIHKTSRLDTCCAVRGWTEPVQGMENISLPGRKGAGRKTILALGNPICWQMELIIPVGSPSSREGDFPTTPIKSHSWSTAQPHPLFTPHQNQGFQVGLGTQQRGVCQLRAHPGWILRAHFQQHLAMPMGKVKHPQRWTARD